MLRKQIFPAFMMLVILSVLTGLIYPLLITVIANVVFPSQAQGSLVTNAAGKVVGSSLIGQSFTGDKYFQPRPSMIVDTSGTPAPYGITSNSSIAASGASNYGPTSADLLKLVQDREAAIRKANPTWKASDPIPTDLLFASASGLDPQISPDAARLQIDRVAAARGFNDDRKTKLKALVEQFVEGPQVGILGQPRVNVLLLNIALDQTQAN